MKEIDKILELYYSRKSENLECVLATVVGIEGSSFRRIGARMLIYEDGIWTGGISGGCLEGDTLKKAKKVMIGKKDNIITYDTRDGDPYQIGVGLGCRGKIDIYLQYIEQSNQKNPLAILEKVSKNRSCQCLVHVLNLPENFKEINRGNIYFDELSELDSIFPDLKQDIQTAISKRRTMIVHYELDIGKVELLIEVVPEIVNLFVVGGNYDIPAIVKFGKLLGWEINLMSDLAKMPKEIISMCRISTTGHIVREIPDELINERTALLLMSHDYKTDYLILKENIGKGIPYIGILGPGIRRKEMLEDLQNAGIGLTDKIIETIHGPIGLDIGADNPETIALSICSEVLSFFNHRSGGSLRDRKGKIYEQYIVKYNTVKNS